MPYCTNCSAQVSNTASFCPECGSNIATSVSGDSEVTSRSSCPSCGSGDKLRWSVMNKSWICDNCGRSFDTAAGFTPVGFTPTKREFYDRSTVTYRDGGFPFSKAIAVILILLVIGTAIGVPLWWFLPTYPLMVVTTPTEGGVTTGTGDYHRNTDVLITADPNECFDFSGWTGLGVANPSSPSTIVHMGSTGQVLTANFERYCIPPGVNHEYWEYFGRSPSYITLDNNDGASDPTWSQLKTFLTNDKTDQETYVEPSFMCGEFAQQVHNNAEEAGIKAGWVRIEFEDDDEADHALNAFMTVDQGLVFVDCTGQEYVSYRNKYNNDKIAFIELGEEYGLISLDVVESFSYGSYEQYMAEWEAYEDSLEQYIDEGDDYDNVLDRCGGYCTDTGGECNCQRLWSWYDELEQKRRQLDRKYQELGGYSWETLGIVKEVKLWW